MGGHIWQLRLETGYESVEWADTPRTSLGGLTKIYRLTHIGIFELNWMNYGELRDLIFVWTAHPHIGQTNIMLISQNIPLFAACSVPTKLVQKLSKPAFPQNIFPQLVKHGVPENVPCLSMSSWFFHSFFPWKARVRGIFPPQFREPLRP